MANKLYEETDIQNIADAIREKTGSDATMTVSQMAMEIEGISGGGLVGTELTQAEYDALPEDEQNNGLYFITDGDATTGVDYIVEQGTSGIWTYRKWNSGLAECWGVYGFEATVDKAWGVLYESATIEPPNYPFNFVNLPLVHYSPYSSSAAWLVETGGSSSSNSITPPRFYVSRGAEITTPTLFNVAIRVIGRWK